MDANLQQLQTEMSWTFAMRESKFYLLDPGYTDERPFNVAAGKGGAKVLTQYCVVQWRI